MSNPTDLEEAIKTRVLVVDDHEPFLRVATGFLQRHQELVVVGAARGGEEGLALAQDLRPEVILMDLRMPGLSGLETISRLRVMLPQVRIIVLTMLHYDSYRDAALAAGADDFVAKRKVTTDLLPAIRRVVSSER